MFQMANHYCYEILQRRGAPTPELGNQRHPADSIGHAVAEEGEKETDCFLIAAAHGAVAAKIDTTTPSETTSYRGFSFSSHFSGNSFVGSVETSSVWPSEETLMSPWRFVEYAWIPIFE